MGTTKREDRYSTENAQPSATARTGTAYGFFDCNALRARIEAYLQGRLPPTSTECAHDFPKPHELGLELKLEEVKELLGRTDIDVALRDTIQRESIYSTYPSAYKHLMASARPVPLKDIKYVVTARSDKTNADVAEKLTTVMNDVYLKFGQKKPFTVGILGKDDSGNYGLWENE